ncbi:MAG: hypothetical protein WA159_16065 [Variovorax sp.]
MINPHPHPSPNSIPIEFAVIKLGEGATAQVAIGALPREGRLPLSGASIEDSHIEMVCADGLVEHIGSPDEPLDAEVLNQARGSEGLWFAEIDEATGAPLGRAHIGGGAL